MKLLSHRASGIAVVVGLILFIGGCATTTKTYQTVKVTNPATGAVTTCEKPLEVWVTKADVKVNVELAYNAKAAISELMGNLDSNGKITGDISSIMEKVKTISQQSFDYMSFLYPFCMANGEGRMTNQEYVQKMDKLLDKFLKENSASVRINRVADMSESRCLNGKRSYKNTITDMLTFSQDIKDYDAQAFVMSKPDGSHEVEVSYQVGNVKVTPIPQISALPQNAKRQSLRVPVNGNQLTVTYVYRQEPSSTDDEWGLSFVSSLGINGIHAQAKLPPGKNVTGLNKRFSDLNNAFAGCTFKGGESPMLECPYGVKTALNVPVSLVWAWDVFEGC